MSDHFTTLRSKGLNMAKLILRLTLVLKAMYYLVFSKSILTRKTQSNAGANPTKNIIGIQQKNRGRSIISNLEEELFLTLDDDIHIL